MMRRFVPLYGCNEEHGANVPMLNGLSAMREAIDQGENSLAP
jgi:hypothetical protein